MIEEEKGSAKDELKRADHLIYVSLKYTRTVDVIRSVIARLISAQEMTINELLQWLKNKKKIKEIAHSKSYRIKTELIKDKLKKDKKAIEFLAFYDFLTKIMKVDYVKKEEFRKNVRMIIHDDKGNVLEEVGVESLKEYYKKACDMINDMETMMK